MGFKIYFFGLTNEVKLLLSKALLEGCECL